MAFYVSYGWTAVFTPIIAMALVALTYRINMIMANNHQVFDYNSLSHKLYEPYDKILSPIYEVCNLGTGILAVSASIAGASSLVNQILGVPYLLCVLVLGILILLVSMFGANLVAKASSVMVVCIVVSVLIICFVGISEKSEELGTILAVKEAPKGLGAAIFKSCTYAGFQSFAFLGVLGVCGALKNEKNCNKATILGFIINCSMLLGTSILLLAWSGDVAGTTLPTLTVCQSLGSNALIGLYSVALFCAFLSTAVAVCFGTINRFGKFHEKFK